MTSHLQIQMVRLGSHATTAGFGAVDPRHHRCRILPYFGALGEALEGVSSYVDRFVPFKSITAGFPCCLVNKVALDFRPIVEEFYGVIESGDLPNNEVTVLHEYGAAKQSVVHHILQVGERLAIMDRTPREPLATAKKYNFGPSGFNTEIFLPRSLFGASV